MRLTSHFDSSEFACGCGCGYDDVSPAHVEKLEMARVDANVPFHVNSGCRCISHNSKVGGVDDSEHLTGEGSDIKTTGSRDRFLIINALIRAGFNRIGIAKTFIHAGSAPDKVKKVIWVY